MSERRIMKCKDRIVFEDLVPSIYFPTGLPEDGGTCAYSTDFCRQNCTNGGIKKDGESNLVISEPEKHTLEIFKREDPKYLAARITKEILETNVHNIPVLQWFVWGDCLPELTFKIAEIISILNAAGFYQYGFTKNLNLWNLVPFKKKLRLAASVESVEEAKRLSKGDFACCSDVTTGYGRFYIDGALRCRCSGWWCEWIERKEIDNSNCYKCIHENQGCFWQSEKQKGGGDG